MPSTSPQRTINRGRTRFSGRRQTNLGQAQPAIAHAHKAAAGERGRLTLGLGKQGQSLSLEQALRGERSAATQNRKEAKRLVAEGIEVRQRRENQGGLTRSAQDTFNKLNEIANALSSSSNE